MQHHSHRCTGSSALVSLLGAEDAPFSALVDDIVFKDESAIVADDLSASLVAGKVAAATFIAFHYVFN
jgi:hypothetical protein